MADMHGSSNFAPVPLQAVRIHDGFWSARMDTNRTVTIPHELEQMEKTGRIDNFRKAAGIERGEFEGIYFNDSDVYKWIEAASYSLATHPDGKLEAKLDEITGVIAAAQEDDGYLNTYYTLKEPDKKWTGLVAMHELYCAGHLIEAAVAHNQATGKRSLLDVACRLADHIGSVFGPGKRRGAPGHEEIELALVKLHRATGERRYFDLAQFFIDVRGREPNTFVQEALRSGDDKYDPSYCQAHAPVREQTEVVGHAVRAMYLYSGMADVCAETGDKSLLDALEEMWRNMTSRRMYITGGVGSTSSGERFTQDYDLPNDTAYAETCAAIGSVFWNHRMFLLTGRSQFADVMELALYNGVLSSIGLDGRSFFYVNPLRVRSTHEREEWFSCACCPPNIARLLASLGGYLYAQKNDAVFAGLYAGSTATLKINGADVTITQETDYPWGGDVEFRIDVPSPIEFELLLRVPGWCEDAAVAVNGQAAEPTGACERVSIRRTWSTGDTVRLSMQMPVARVEACPHVEADFGKVALRRGPIVYCLEEADNGRELFQLTLPAADDVKASFRQDLLGGVMTLEALAERPDASDWGDALYRTAPGSGAVTRKIVAVPYCTWANRGPGEMTVWLNNGR